MIQGQTRVAKNDSDVSTAILQIGEVPLGELNHIRVDFIEAKLISGPAIGRQSSNSQSDHSNPPWFVRRSRFEGLTDARLFCVVSCRNFSSIWCRVLKSMKDPAMN